MTSADVRSLAVAPEPRIDEDEVLKIIGIADSELSAADCGALDPLVAVRSARRWLASYVEESEYSGKSPVERAGSDETVTDAELRSRVHDRPGGELLDIMADAVQREMPGVVPGVARAAVLSAWEVYREFVLCPPVGGSSGSEAPDA